MTHLGSQISALADGQLDPAVAERALAHVAACAQCAAELAAARAARQTLAAAADCPLDPELMARLMALGGPGRPPQEGGQGRPWSADARRPGAAPAGGGFVGWSLPMPGSPAARDLLPADCLHGDLNRGRTPGRIGMALTGAAVVVASALFVLGQEPPVVPSAHPAHALTLLGRAGSPAPVDGAGDRTAASAVTGTSAAAVLTGFTPRGTGQDVTADPSAALRWLEDHGWASPGSLPTGYSVTGVRDHVDGSDALEIDLVGPNGVVVVTEELGRLDVAALEGAHHERIGGRDVHVLSEAPWHAVWQSGDTVVNVVAAGDAADLEELVSAYPARDFDPGVAARIARGWRVLAGAWAP